MLNLNQIQSPCYVLLESKLEQNLQKLKHIEDESGAKVLIALKGYALCETMPLISSYLSGVATSGLWESRLANEFFKTQIHTYSPAFSDTEIDEVINLSSHIIFNSISQLKRYKNRCMDRDIGLRVNIEYCEVDKSIYDTCDSNSRLGVTIDVLQRELQMDKNLLKDVKGFHFHSHFQHNSDVLERSLYQLDFKFGKYIKNLKWINFGGGQAITRDNYDSKKLIELIKEFKAKYSVEVFLEPSEAIAFNAGVLVSTILDITKNKTNIAILDVSATNHMPDIIETSIKPQIYGAKSGKYIYSLGGVSCLAGDVIGDYSFDKPLNIGDKIIFENLAVYSFVRTNTFNGVKLPSLGILKKDGSFKLIKEFSYNIYRDRL